MAGSRVGQRLAREVYIAVAVEPFGELLDGASEDLCGFPVPSEYREAAGTLNVEVGVVHPDGPGRIRLRAGIGQRGARCVEHPKRGVMSAFEPRGIGSPDWLPSRTGEEAP